MDARDPPDPLIGRTLAGRYVIESRVGEGSVGRVYRARHARTGRPFAIKVLYPEMAADERMRARFVREAHAASALDHPCVVPVLDCGEAEDGLAYLAMSFVDGPALGEIIRVDAPLRVERAVQLARGIALGLAHAHERGLIHRDLKPDNIMVVHQGGREQVRIVDFGLAIAASPSAPRLTAKGGACGTPVYSAPEQVRGAPDLDARADLYSLGATLHEMLTGRPPLGEDLSREVHALAGGLGDLLTRLLAAEPDRRPSSAAGVARELEEIATELAEKRLAWSGGETPVAGPPPPRRWWRLVVPLAAAAALALAWRWRSHQGPAAPATQRRALAADAGAGPVIERLPLVDARAREPAPIVVTRPPAPAPRRERRVVEPPPPPSSPPRALPAPALPAPAPPATPVAPDPGDTTVQALSERYRAVGAALDELARSKAPRASEPLRRRYFAIPFADVLRDPSQRPSALRRLRELEREIARAHE